MTPQERRARREALAAKRAATIVEQATAKVMAARPIAKVEPSPPSSPQGEMATAAEVKRLRDEGKMSWMAIGAKLGLPGAKNGAGSARRYYAMVNRGQVPRTHAPRKNATPKPVGPASRGVPAYLRKEALVRDGHVIPRDMPDEEVEALVRGRAIEWAIDMARLTNTDPATWGPEDGRWVKQEAKVHVDHEWVRVVRDEDSGERLLYFREYAGFDTDRQRHMSGPTKVVRVDSIYTVR